MATMSNEIRSPKQPQAQRKRDWYPYYAGYSAGFVGDVIDHFAACSRSVIDPWNGAGTTTVVASMKGLRSTGIDINPALSVVSKARHTPLTVADSLSPLGLRLVKTANQRFSSCEIAPNDDLLATWYRLPSLRFVRALQVAIHDALTTTNPLSEPVRHVEDLPVLAAFFYTALFGAVRDSLQRFRSSNPTWLRFPRRPQSKIMPSREQLAWSFQHHIRRLARLLVLSTPSETDRCRLVTASAQQLPVETGAHDAAVTSPPYCTRIDYVRSSLAELAVLNLSSGEADALRSATTGTPVLSGGESQLTTDLPSSSARSLLRAIKAHPSKGSRGYYYPWMLRYLSDLNCSMRELHRAVRPDGPICIVVQDSYYKETRIDLQTIATDFLQNLGRTRIKRVDFRVTHLRSTMNPAARRHEKNRSAVESLCVFN